MSDVYFSKHTFRFLNELQANNSREWFTANRARYEADVREPSLRLIADLAAPLAKISSHFVADPRKQGGSLFRIHRDTRFANDKTPYKTWSGARFAHERAKQVPAPSFYLHIQPGGCFAGGGIWHPESPTLKRIRDFLVDNPATWKRGMRGKAFREKYGFWGDRLTRPPRGYDAAHELIDELKMKNFAAGADFPDTIALSSELLPQLVTTFKGVAPLNDYLCAALDLEF